MSATRVIAATAQGTADPRPRSPLLPKRERAAAIDNGDSPDLLRCHGFHCFRDVIVRRARLDLTRAHDLAHAHAAVAAFGDDTNGDVSIGDDTEEAPVSLLLDDGDDADVF